MIKKIAFIGHPTTDLAVSRRFYGEVLGLAHAVDYEEHWAEYHTPEGATIALDTISPKQVPNPTPYIALETDDIEAEVARLREQGVTVTVDTWTNQFPDGRPICKMAMIVDPGGNPIMLHEIAAWRAGEADAGADESDGEPD